MITTSDSLNQLIEEFAQLPGIGRKSAQRLALYILKLSKEEVTGMAQALINVKEKIRYCSNCWNFTEDDPCGICANPKREGSVICVVEEPQDLLAIERSGAFRGKYHVLHGVLSPLSGVTFCPPSYLMPPGGIVFVQFPRAPAPLGATTGTVIVQVPPAGINPSLQIIA